VGKHLNVREDVVLHNFLTGKDCHLFFYKNPSELEKLRDDIQDILETGVPLEVTTDPSELVVTKAGSSRT
jgi:hypothetical protein